LRGASPERRHPRLLCAAALVLAVACQKGGAPGQRVASINDDLIALPNAMAVRVRGAQLEAVAPDGALRWKLDLDPDEAVVGKLCAAANSSIYVRTNQALRAASAEGRWSWQVEMPMEAPLLYDATLYEPAALTDSSAVALVNPRSYRAVSANGAGRWQFDLPDGERPLAPPRSSPNGQLYLSSDVGIYSVNPEGKLSWRLVR
jgi:hypothetical protein